MSIYKKLLLVQGEIKAIEKSETNPFYKSKFFDVNAVIAALRPVLNKHGVVVLQPLTELNGKPAIKTIVADGETGETISETLPLMEGSDVQKFGATCTYTRRFALVSLFLLQGENDDDGNSVVQRAESKPAPSSYEPRAASKPVYR